MRTVCGLDVHKDTIYLCILCETGEIFEHVYGILTHQPGRKSDVKDAQWLLYCKV